MKRKAAYSAGPARWAPTREIIWAPCAGSYTGGVSADLDERLDALALEWRVSLSTAARSGVAGYVRTLLTWNAKVNLTAARDATDVVGEHVVDAFAMARLVPPAAAVCDVGAGGGLPGIPFALLRPDCVVTMVEPRAKRVAFLRTAVRECRLATAQVLRARAEELPRQGFDVAGARATFGPEEWLAVGATLVRPGGLVLVFSATPVAASGALVRAAAVEYRTAAGHARWLGGFRAGATP